MDDSVLESQMLLPVADCDLGKGDYGSGGTSKGYGSLEEVGEQPILAPGDGGTVRGMLPEETPASRMFLLTCMCIPDSSAVRPTPSYEKYCSKSET